MKNISTVHKEYIAASLPQLFYIGGDTVKAAGIAINGPIRVPKKLRMSFKTAMGIILLEKG
ncbi:hypothetical protein J23TS9_20870 [Paenibacillus sp. J23TS9]|nr:hypothetical protein J23TS9_20870 [Paenibacillus sp. J23TS9]